MFAFEILTTQDDLRVDTSIRTRMLGQFRKTFTYAMNFKGILKRGKIAIVLSATFLLTAAAHALTLTGFNPFTHGRISL